MFFATGDFVAGPSEGLLVLLKYMLFLVFLIHLPFLFTAMGGSLLSLLFNFLDHDKKNPRYARLSKDLADKSLINPWAGLLLGIIPVFAAFAMILQYLYHTPLVDFSRIIGVIPFDKYGILTPTYPYLWFGVAANYFIGFALLYIYQATFAYREKHFWWHFLPGLLGLLSLIKGSLLFVSQKTFLLYPTMWHMLDNPIQMIFGSITLPEFGLFLHLAFAFAGAALFFKFTWSREISPLVVVALGVLSALLFLPALIGYISLTETDLLTGRVALEYFLSFFIIAFIIVNLAFLLFGKDPNFTPCNDDDPEYTKLAKKSCLIFALVFVLGLPVPVFLEYLFMETASFSSAIVASFGMLLLVALFYALSVISGLFHLEETKGKWLVPFAFLCVVFYLLGDQTARATALREQILYLKDHAKTLHPEGVPEEVVEKILHGGGSTEGGVLSKLSFKGKKGFQ
ncbi:MAG: hypothetical protein D6785_05955, partial [Planctomycetota bacterium]